jgi:hypothetical protein
MKRDEDTPVVEAVRKIRRKIDRKYNGDVELHGKALMKLEKIWRRKLAARPGRPKPVVVPKPMGYEPDADSPIVQDVRKVREQIARECDYDIHKVAHALTEDEARLKRKNIASRIRKKASSHA